MRKIIAISGVPGTGKTQVAEILAENIGASLILIKDIIEKERVRYAWDTKRKTKIVDVPSLKKAVTKNLNPGLNVVEGLLAYLLKSDVLVILRCNPLVLKKRLRKRKWPEGKVAENVASEVLGVITIEALSKKGKKLYEIDTTGLKPEKTAAIIDKILKDSNYAKHYQPGKIDWLVKYSKKITALL